MTENDLDCQNCGKRMFWKYLKKPLCPCCNAVDVEKVFASKTDMFRNHGVDKLRFEMSGAKCLPEILGYLK